MASFVIEGGHSLSGDIYPQGAKNEVLQIICATLLTAEEVTVHNIPDILDVNNLIQLMRDMGVNVSKKGIDTYSFQAANVDFAYLESDEFLKRCSSLRGSVMLVGPMVARFGKAMISKPGGDKIGRRRLDTHFIGIRNLGAEFVYNERREVYEISARQLQGSYMLLDEASVTGTANIVMAAVLAKGKTTIYNAACELYIQQLCRMLNRMGAKIEGIASNLLTIEGVDELHGTEHTVLPDMIEVGSFIGMAAIICSGIMLKKTKAFAGDPAPFVMELPAYHVPAWGNVLRATWERGWSFIKRAGSVILAATVVLWFLQGFGFENGAFGMVEDQDNSVLAAIATKVAWIFAPLGFGNWRATVASVSGLIAKENVVGTFGVLYHFGGELSENGDEIWAAVAQDYTALSAYAFMIFNLLCAPCFAAMGAIKREMNNGRWTAIAIGYMCALAYCAALVVYQLGGLITGEVHFGLFTVVAVVVLAAFIYLMVRPNKYADNNEVKLDTSRI
mgnify:CR=1 FL=1